MKDQTHYADDATIAELESLRAKCTELEAEANMQLQEVRRLGGVFDEIKTTLLGDNYEPDEPILPQLVRQRAELERDARRYRWLRERPLSPHFMDGWYVVQVLSDDERETTKVRNLGDLDAAIDEAMGETT